MILATKLLAMAIGATLLLAACGSQPVADRRPGPQDHQPAGSPSTLHIELERSVHFDSPDATTLVAGSGRYVVVPLSGESLRLVPGDGGNPVSLQARAATHDVDLATPFVLSFTESDDAPHLLLLLPDGTALDAVGSFSGIRPRDATRTNRHYQFIADSGTVKFGGGVAGGIPSTGQADISASYRTGTGAAGNSGSGGEIQMIQLQSLISQRQTALALTDAILRAQNERFHLEYNINRPGGDYAQRAEPTPESCRTVCSSDMRCQAFTFVKPPAGSANGQCFLKQTVPAQVGSPCCTSAKRKSAQEEMIGNIR